MMMHHYKILCKCEYHKYNDIIFKGKKVPKSFVANIKAHVDIMMILIMIMVVVVIKLENSVLVNFVEFSSGFDLDGIRQQKVLVILIFLLQHHTLD